MPPQEQQLPTSLENLQQALELFNLLMVEVLLENERSYHGVSQKTLYSMQSQVNSVAHGRGIPINEGL